MNGIIVHAFILSGVLIFLGVLSFIWLNAQKAKTEDHSYDERFDPGTLVSAYRSQGNDKEDNIDPAHELRMYAHKIEPRQQLSTKTPAASPVPATKPGESYLDAFDVADLTVSEEKPARKPEEKKEGPVK